MTDERIVAYLLRELPDEEAERFEEECFAEENLTDQIISVEGDLINAYLRDELTPEQRRRFRESYVTTEARRERVAIAAALLRHLDTSADEDDPVVSAPPAGPTWAERLTAFWGRQTWGVRAGLAVGVIVIIAGPLWLFRTRTPAPRTFATLTLAISIDRNRGEGAQADRVSLPPGADALRVILRLPEQPTPAARYRVELVNDSGGVSPLGVARREADAVSVEIPASQLARGQYALRLFAVRPDGAEQRLPGSYFFTVE